eukprot:snap_masked-scaffold_5-processed-gene-17.19-mRNA-1 protein AED:1.00 eAED:1.00 QI:0/0/0/0/1/1/2/0/700
MRTAIELMVLPGLSVALTVYNEDKSLILTRLLINCPESFQRICMEYNFQVDKVGAVLVLGDDVKNALGFGGLHHYLSDVGAKEVSLIGGDFVENYGSGYLKFMSKVYPEVRFGHYREFCSEQSRPIICDDFFRVYPTSEVKDHKHCKKRTYSEISGGHSCPSDTPTRALLFKVVVPEEYEILDSFRKAKYQRHISIFIIHIQSKSELKRLLTYENLGKIARPVFIHFSSKILVKKKKYQSFIEKYSTFKHFFPFYEEPLHKYLLHSYTWTQAVSSLAPLIIPSVYRKTSSPTSGKLKRDYLRKFTPMLPGCLLDLSKKKQNVGKMGPIQHSSKDMVVRCNDGTENFQNGVAELLNTGIAQETLEFALSQETGFEDINEIELADWRYQIYFLGTGGSKPSRSRNTSGILLEIGEKFILLDCGEGTLQQLELLFERKVVETVIPNLVLVWISHYHFDHHSGLTSILLLKKKLLGLKTTIFCPTKVLTYLEDIFGSTNNCNTKNHRTSTHWFSAYHCSEIFKLKAIDRLVTNFSSHEVLHCQDSFAVSFLIHVEGRSILVVYSGDTRPFHRFVQSVKEHYEDMDIYQTVLIHEANYFDDQIEQAKRKRHSTVTEALSIGRAMGADLVLLTHASRRYSGQILKGAVKKKNLGKDAELKLILEEYTKRRQICNFLPVVDFFKLDLKKISPPPTSIIKYLISTLVL